MLPTLDGESRGNRIRKSPAPSPPLATCDASLRPQQHYNNNNNNNTNFLFDFWPVIISGLKQQMEGNYHCDSLGHSLCRFPIDFSK